MFSIHIRLPRPSLKQIFVGSLGGSFGVVSVLLGVAAYIVNTLTRPKRLDNFSDLYTFTPFELNLPAEEVTFSSLHAEHQVSGWYIAHPEATATILVCPGYRGRRSDVLGMSGQLWKAGYNVLAFEYYGHGTIVGEPVTLGYREMNDFLGAVAYAKQRAPQTRLGAVGYSMGASIAIMATARTPEIEVLVADSGFATHRSAVGYAVRRTIHLPFVLFDWFTDLLLWLRAGYHFNQVEPLRDIGRIAPRPVLIIHGLKDTMVDPEDAKLLYAAAQEPKELWLDAHAEHCGIYFEDRIVYVERVIGFLDRNLRRHGSSAQVKTHEQQTRLSEAS
ncbi:MAG: alpha/beta hydrolase [Ktedonobacteraceae bacterium]